MDNEDYLTRLNERFNELDDSIILYGQSSSWNIGTVTVNLSRVLDVINQRDIPEEHQETVLSIGKRIIDMNKENMMAQMDNNPQAKLRVQQLMRGIQNDLNLLSNRLT